MLNSSTPHLDGREVVVAVVVVSMFIPPPLYWFIPPPPPTGGQQQEKVTRTSGQEEGTGQREMDPAVDLALHSGPLRVGTNIVGGSPSL